MRILRRLSWQIEGLRFFLRNIAASSALPEAEPAICGELTLRGCAGADLRAVDQLHCKLRDGESLNHWRKLLYRLRGKRLIYVVTDGGGAIIGFEMFYFKAGEVQEDVIHEAFVGLEERWRGRGIATQLRRYAAKHFRRANVRGVSSNVPHDNTASLQSALAAGFEVDEAASSSEAYYLRLPLTATSMPE